MNSNHGKIRLIAGLGNPGSEYEGTRHNAGFAFIEHFLRRMPGSWEKVHAFDSYCWRGTYAGSALILQTPLTYMNLSGNAICKLAAAEKIAPEETLVVSDDMDLAPGRIRLRQGGGSGGHNGLKSVTEKFGSDKFARLRIGIGKMPNGHGSADFVLSGFSADEQILFDKVMETACDAVIFALRRNLALAMTQFNSTNLAESAEPGSLKENKTDTNKNSINQETQP